jgi:hypothetical protein
MGVDRWKRKVDRWGLEALRVRERRRPRMPTEIGRHLEQRMIAFCLRHPGSGARRIGAELARAKWGGIRISDHVEPRHHDPHGSPSSSELQCEGTVGGSADEPRSSHLWDVTVRVKRLYVWTRLDRVGIEQAQPARREGCGAKTRPD